MQISTNKSSVPRFTGASRRNISSGDKNQQAVTKSQKDNQISIPELTYPNTDWTENLQVVRGTNCYAYMRNDPNVRGNDTQPGKFLRKANELTCENVRSSAEKDGLTSPIKEDGCSSVCPPDHHLGYLIIAPGVDYHWIRENTNTYQGGRWSHKHGFGSYPTNADGLGNVISCPSDANHHYAFRTTNSSDLSWLNYTEPCGYLCAPTNPPTDSRGLSTGQIAGIATGATVTVMLVLAAAGHKWIPNNPISKAIQGYFEKTHDKERAIPTVESSAVLEIEEA